jgi:hypothetical protein
MKAVLKGATKMIQTLKQFAEKYPDQVAAALYQEAQIEATEMKKRTPVDTTPNAPHPGNLRNSIHVEDPERKGRTISVEIATGAQAPYAVYVHENPDAYHPVGEWKFMESVLNESRSHMADRIARRIHLNRVKL